MTFASEEVRTEFHLLPAQKQLELCELELYYYRLGKQLHIESVKQDQDGSEVLIRIDEKLELAFRSRLENSGANELSD